MFTPLRRTDQALFLTGLLAGMSAAACSKAADRQPSTESAASTPAERTMSDSSARPTDTPVKPARTPPLPKPNIDPGRKPPTMPADTSKAAAPAPAGQDQWLKFDA